MSASHGERQRLRFPRLPSCVCTVLVALFLALPLLGRFLDLSADPPLNVAFIHAFATDEGYYSFHARTVVLFGERPDAAFWDNERVSPLFDWLLQGSFALFGVNLVSLRLPQAILGCGTVGLLYLLLRSSAGPRAAFWGALFLAWNHLFFVFNRVGMYQTLLTFLCTACALAWLLAWRRPAWGLLSGAAFALAVLTSLFSLLFLAGLGAATLLLVLGQWVRPEQGARPLWRARWTVLLFFLVGLALVWIPVSLLFVLPQAELVQRDLARSSALPFYTEPLQTVANLFMALYHPVYLLNLIPLCGMLAYSGWTLSLWRTRRPEPLEALLLGWFWSGAAVLAVVNYRPTRYFLYLLVPLCAALAVVVARWAEVRERPGLLRWLAVPLLYVAALVLWDHLDPQRFHGDALWWSGVALSGIAALAVVVLSLGPCGRKALARCGSALAVAFLFGQAALGLSAWVGRSHSVEQVSREIGRLLPEDALLLRGCTLTLENRLHCLPMIEPEEVDVRAFSGYRLFYLTEAPVEGLPGDRLWGAWPVLDKTARLYEVAPWRESLAGLDMGHY